MKRWPNDWAPKPNISYTSMKTFDECERKWLYQYAPAPISRQLDYDLRVQARLLPWNMLIGQVVHDVIQETIRTYQRTNQWLADPMKRANEILRGYSKRTITYRRECSRGQLSLFGNPQPVDRIFFEDTITKEEVRYIRDQINLCLANFMQSGITDFIAKFPPSSYRITEPVEVQPIPWFWTENIPVYASYDFAIVTPERSYLFDWKTGKKLPRSENDALEQLHSYAIYAMTEWKIPAEQIHLVLFWLACERGWQTFSVDPELLERLQSRWRERYKELLKRFGYCGEDLQQWLQSFPLTPFIMRCRYCPIRACEGHARKEDQPPDWVAEEEMGIYTEEWEQSYDECT
jgi:hypothetical protein